MFRLTAIAVCVVVGACSPKADREPKTAQNSVVIPDAPGETVPDDTPAPSSNEGPSATPEGEEDESDEVEEDSPPPWGGSSPSGSRGGPLCDQAADCCLKIMTLSAKSPSLSKTCNAFRNAHTAACQSLLNTLSQAAPQMGLSCP